MSFPTKHQSHQTIAAASTQEYFLFMSYEGSLFCHQKFILFLEGTKKNKIFYILSYFSIILTTSSDLKALKSLNICWCCSFQRPLVNRKKYGCHSNRKCGLKASFGILVEASKGKSIRDRLLNRYQMTWLSMANLLLMISVHRNNHMHWLIVKNLRKVRKGSWGTHDALPIRVKPSDQICASMANLLQILPIKVVSQIPTICQNLKEVKKCCKICLKY